MTGKTSKTGKKLIGNDQIQTVANLTIWLRDNVGHGALDYSEPAQRFLESRLHPKQGEKVAVTELGCHSSAKLMVDLARSVNIPLLHIRSQEHDRKDAHFFNRTHGGLIIGWGGPTPRILTHTDDIYAMPDEPAFPIDKHGVLLPPEQAARAVFYQRWKTASQLRAEGFVYDLQKVYPEKGFGVTSAGIYENRADYGMFIGYWKQNILDEMARWKQKYELCSNDVLSLSCRKSLAAQYYVNLDRWKKELVLTEMPAMPTGAEFEKRGNVCVKAFESCDDYKQKVDAWKNDRGSGLMK
jgi:hypothetical protein